MKALTVEQLQKVPSTNGDLRNFLLIHFTPFSTVHEPMEQEFWELHSNSSRPCLVDREPRMGIPDALSNHQLIFEAQRFPLDGEHQPFHPFDL